MELELLFLQLFNLKILKMTKKQNKIAQEILAKKPKEVKGLFMNPKGEFFTNESLAKNSLEKDEELKWVSRENKVSDKAEDNKEDKHPILGVSVPEIRLVVKTIMEVSELEQLLKDEKAGQNRKGSIEAIEARIDELKEAQDNG